MRRTHVVHLGPQSGPLCCTKDTLLDSLLPRGHFCGAMCQFHTPHGGWHDTLNRAINDAFVVFNAVSTQVRLCVPLIVYGWQVAGNAGMAFCIFK
jgi:hypothetical protein